MFRQAQPQTFPNATVGSLSASLDNGSSMLTKVQSEWADRYVEVEVEGLSLKRLGCIYVAVLSHAKFRMLQGVRSFFHLNPAH